MTAESTATENNPLESIRFEAKTDIGLRREENQDSFGILEKERFKICFVADGMGGVKGGAIASGLAVEVIKEQLGRLAAIDEVELAEAITAANVAIFERGSKEPGLNGMGTTVVMLAFTGTKLLIANVGDSRAYRIRDGGLEQLTEDHTLVNELVKAGTITEDQAGSHPVSHMLTRSLGPTPEVQVDSFESYDPPHRGDYYLLCSDGLYNMVHPEEFVEVIQSLSIEEVPAELISLANLRGGTDNITVILVKVGDEYPLPKLQETVGEEDESSFTLGEGEHNRAVDDRVEAKIDLEKLRAATHGEASASAQEYTKDETEDGNTAHAADPDSRAEGDPAVSTGAVTHQTRSWILKYGIGIAVASACLTIAYSFGRMHQESPPVEVKNEIPIVAAPPSSLNSVASHSSASAIVVASASVSSVDAIASSAASAPSSQSAASVSSEPANVPAIVQASSAGSPSHLDVVHARVVKLQEKLAAFDQPITGKLAETLGQSLSKLTEQEKKLDTLTATLQDNSDKLSKWLGLKRRLQEQNPVDLAGEVAALSPEVKATQENFQKATWAYLQQFEAWQNSNNNPELDKKVQELAQGRTDTMSALTEKVKQVVEQEISKSDKAVGDSTFERDTLYSEIRALRMEVSFARTLVGNDPQARELLKKQLKGELLQAEAELKQYELLGPQAVSGQTN